MEAKLYMQTQGGNLSKNQHFSKSCSYIHAICVNKLILHTPPDTEWPDEAAEAHQLLPAPALDGILDGIRCLDWSREALRLLPIVY